MGSQRRRRSVRSGAHYFPLRRYSRHHRHALFHGPLCRPRRPSYPGFRGFHLCLHGRLPNHLDRRHLRHSSGHCFRRVWCWYRGGWQDRPDSHVHGSLLLHLHLLRSYLRLHPAVGYWLRAYSGRLHDVPGCGRHQLEVYW